MSYLEIIKTIGKVLKEVDKIELYQQLLEVNAKLLELQNENSELKKKNRKLEDKSKFEDELIIKNNAYWKITDNDGPFCTRCWDKNKDRIRMRNDKDITYYCLECKNVYYGPNYESYHANYHAIPLRPRRDWSSF